MIVDAETKSLLAAAQGFGIHLSVIEATNERELDLAFATLSQHSAQALFVTSSPLFESRRDQLAALTARHALPALFETRDYAEAGGLASYGSDYALAYHEAGAYVGRILRGAKPADLRVVQLSKIELVINAKTAKALGLTLPPAILTRADEVIE